MPKYKDYIISPLVDRDLRRQEEILVRGYHDRNDFNEDKQKNLSDDEQVADLVEKAESTLTTSQRINSDSMVFGVTGIINPPIDLLLWANALNKNSRLHRSINTYARNTVGLGWEIKSRVDIQDETEPDVDKKRVKEEKTRAVIFFRDINPNITFTRLMYLVKVDEESTGNGYIEAVRNNGGDLEQFWHVPSHTIRILRNGLFIQMRGHTKKYFKPFGDERTINAETGEEENLALDLRATELIHFKLYSPVSEHYGLPKYIPAAPAIAGNRHAADRNVNFFLNDAVPRMALLVSGSQVTPETIKMIQKQFDGTKGPENSSRLVVMQADTRQAKMGQETKVDLQLVPLTVGVTDDSSFSKYRKDNDEEVREVFGIAKAFFTSEDVNKAVAVIGKQLTNEQEFEPDRLEKEEFFQKHIIEKELGLSLVEFKFKRPQLVDALDQAKRDRLHSQSGALTPNDIRENLQKERYPDEESWWADRPLPIAQALVQQGAISGEGLENLSDGDSDDDSSDGDTVDDKGLSRESRMVQVKLDNLMKVVSMLSNEIQELKLGEVKE